MPITRIKTQARRGGPRKTAPARLPEAPSKTVALADPGTAARMRSLPQQERARAAVERILDATGELLDESGFESLTTTAIAVRAGVNIATLYRYFPDKFKEVHEFAVRLERERIKATVPVFDRFVSEANWRGPMRDIVTIALRQRVSRPGGRTLNRALQSSPELWAVDRAQTLRSIGALASALRRRKPDLSKAIVERVAATAVNAGTSLLNAAVTSGSHPRKSIEEALLMLERYLELYLD